MVIPSDHAKLRAMLAWLQIPDNQTAREAIAWYMGTVVLIPLFVKAFLYLFRKAFLSQFEELIGFMKRQEEHNA